MSKQDVSMQQLINHVETRYALTGKNTQAVADTLAHILNIEPAFVRHASHATLEVMCGTLLYFNLDGADKTLVMAKINSLFTPGPKTPAAMRTNALSAALIHTIDTVKLDDETIHQRITGFDPGFQSMQGFRMMESEADKQEKHSWSFSSKNLLAEIKGDHNMKHLLEKVDMLGGGIDVKGGVDFFVELFKTGRVSIEGVVTVIVGTTIIIESLKVSGGLAALNKEKKRRSPPDRIRS